MAELFGELDEVDEGGEEDIRAVRIRIGEVFGVEVLYSSGRGQTGSARDLVH